MLKDVSTENELIHVRRPDVNDIVAKGTDTYFKINDSKGGPNDIINAYK